MSGFEIVGVVLGSIPLVLAGLEFYANGIAVSKRFIKYRVHFDELVKDLRTERTLFENTINTLLFGIIPSRDMAHFLANPCGDDRWKEKKFEKKLMERLGRSYESYMITIAQMNRTVGTMWEKLKLDPSGKPQFSDKNTIKEHYQRLRFSLKRSDYSDLIGKIRQFNYSLDRLTSQTMSIETLQRPCKASPNFNLIKSRAESSYSALRSGWKCPCYIDHSVSLLLEPRMEDCFSYDEDNDDDDQISTRDLFHVLFRYSHPNPNPNRLQSLTTPPHPWTWEEADVRIALASQSSTATRLALSPLGKGVRFVISTEAKKAVKAVIAPDPNLQPIEDLCSAIITLQKPERDVCFSLLASEYTQLNYTLLIQPSKTPPSDPESWSVFSLRSVLNDRKFTRSDRLHLAITLASSVLQLHDTSWLDENLGKDNVFFIKRSEKLKYNHPFVSQNFNQAASSNMTTPMTVTMSRIIRNQTLYALGVSLIELWHGKTLNDLRVPEDGIITGNPTADLIMEWTMANRLVDELYTDGAGPKYSDAVRRCIRCDFDRQSNKLEDAEFQKAVFMGVVSQLKENFNYLINSKGLMLDTLRNLSTFSNFKPIKQILNI